MLINIKECLKSLKITYFRSFFCLKRALFRQKIFDEIIFQNVPLDEALHSVEVFFMFEAQKVSKNDEECRKIV